MNKNKTVIVFGSSRPNGNTKQMINILNEAGQFEIVDLSSIKMSYFDYDHKNASDDFIPLMDRLTKDYNTLLFATPVYWYSMSALMKCFFDRITDLLTIEKEIGRRLRKMNMVVVSCSDGNDLTPCFIDVFKNSADYLGMNFQNHTHCWFENDGTIGSEVKGNLTLLRSKL